jgi:ribosomal protein S18 acetylase RimI-like enzyme
MADSPQRTPETLRMRVELGSSPPAPAWPEGVVVRDFRPADGPRLHALLEHGYRNGGGSVVGYDAWLPAITGDSEFDPQLCLLVEDGDELVAAAICWTSAFVKDIVVHESRRGQRLGEALLREALGRLHERGATAVELKVHADNTSAIRLYERVGMVTVERIPAA